jgi:Zn finger protein HypA/HybF involved in hydrogenase expression
MKQPSAYTPYDGLIPKSSVKNKHLKVHCRFCGAVMDRAAARRNVTCYECKTKNQKIYRYRKNLKAKLDAYGKRK